MLFVGSTNVSFGACSVLALKSFLCMFMFFFRFRFSFFGSLSGAAGRQVRGEAGEAGPRQEGSAQARPAPAATDHDLQEHRDGAPGHAQGRQAAVRYKIETVHQ